MLRCQSCGQTAAETPCSEVCAQARFSRRPWQRLGDVLWGTWMVWTRPQLIGLSFLPLCLTVGLLLGGLWFSFAWFQRYLNAWLADTVSSPWGLPLLQTLVTVFSTFGIVLLLLVLFLPVAAVLTMPFMDPVAAQIETRLLGEAREAPPFHLPTLLREMGLLTLLKLVLLLPALFFWVPVLGPLLVLFSLALILSLDFLDLIWMRKGYAFAEKKAFLRANLGGWLLFTLPLMLMIWVPVLQVLLLPGASAGAVRFFLAARKTPASTQSAARPEDPAQAPMG